MKNIAFVLFLFAIGLAACQPGARQAEQPVQAAGGTTAQIYLPGGDGAAGRQVFLDMKCNTCHGVPTDGIERRVEGNLGPDLGKVQAEKSRDYLATSIIAPSHAITSAEGQWKEGELSRMGDYSTHLNVRQWFDLVAYLKSLD